MSLCVSDQSRRVVRPLPLLVSRAPCIRSVALLFNPMILILSADAVGAALLGALIETLGYDVKFARPPEAVEESFRRVRPKVSLIDCTDASVCNPEVLGRAAMRRISVVIFG